MIPLTISNENHNELNEVIEVNAAHWNWTSVKCRRFTESLNSDRVVLSFEGSIRSSRNRNSLKNSSSNLRFRKVCGFFKGSSLKISFASNFWSACQVKLKLVKCQLSTIVWMDPIEFRFYQDSVWIAQLLNGKTVAFFSLKVPARFHLVSHLVPHPIFGQRIFTQKKQPKKFKVNKIGQLLWRRAGKCFTCVRFRNLRRQKMLFGVLEKLPNRAHFSVKFRKRSIQ